MPKHKPLQGNCPNIMPRAGFRVTPVVGADEKVLICFESVCRAIVKFYLPVRTEYLSRKDTDFPRCSRAAFVSTDFLYRFQDILVYNGSLSIFKYPAVFLLIPHTLFASVILGGCLEVFGMSDILQLLQNPCNGFLCPFVWFGWKQFSLFLCPV